MIDSISSRWSAFTWLLLVSFASSIGADPICVGWQQVLVYETYMAAWLGRLQLTDGQGRLPIVPDLDQAFGGRQLNFGQFLEATCEEGITDAIRAAVSEKPNIFATLFPNPDEVQQTFESLLFTFLNDKNLKAWTGDWDLGRLFPGRFATRPPYGTILDNFMDIIRPNSDLPANSARLPRIKAIFQELGRRRLASFTPDLIAGLEGLHIPGLNIRQTTEIIDGVEYNIFDHDATVAASPSLTENQRAQILQKFANDHHATAVQHVNLAAGEVQGLIDEQAANGHGCGVMKRFANHTVSQRTAWAN